MNFTENFSGGFSPCARETSLGDLQLPPQVLRILPQLQGVLPAARVMTPGGDQTFGCLGWGVGGWEKGRKMPGKWGWEAEKHRIELDRGDRSEKPKQNLPTCECWFSGVSWMTGPENGHGCDFINSTETAIGRLVHHQLQHHLTSSHIIAHPHHLATQAKHRKAQVPSPFPASPPFRFICSVHLVSKSLLYSK